MALIVPAVTAAPGYSSHMKTVCEYVILEGRGKCVTMPRNVSRIALSRHRSSPQASWVSIPAGTLPF